MSNEAGEAPSIEDLLRQARQSDAYKDMPQEEFFLKMLSSLYNELKEPSKESAPAGKEEGKSVVVEKEFVYPGIEDAYIYRHKGKNYYYREKDKKTNRWENGFSLKVGTNRDHAIVKAQQVYTERSSKKARGILHKSINTKQLVNLYLAYEAKRIKIRTKRGLTQKSYDSKIGRLKYWQTYIKENGHERRVIEDIPPMLGDLFANWIDDLPKERYKDTPRDINTINHIVSTTKAMFMWANKNSYIGNDDIPKFKYMDSPVGHDQRYDRDILWEHEWQELEQFIRYKHCVDKTCNVRELRRRKQFSIFLRLHYATGMRLKELRELKWNQISEPKHITNYRQKRINRSLFFPATKTSRQRTIISPISFLIDDLVELYQDIGVKINKSSDKRVFFNIFSRSFDESTWYSETTMTRKLDALMIESGLYDKLSKENPARRITLNSGRHFFATYKIINDRWSYEELSLHLGNSKQKCEERYSKATAEMIRSKNMKNDGLNRIESYVFKSEDGKEIDNDTQERLKDALVSIVTDRD